MKPEKIIPTAVLIVLQLGITLSASPMAEDEGEARWQSHFPGDAELFLPEPIPKLDETIELMVNQPKGQLVSYVPLTGEETFLDINLKDMPPEIWMPGSEGDEPQTPEGQFNLMNFSDLSLIANPEDWPWPPNCKMYYTRRGTQYTASAVLIDAYHVLCAGHSLHEGNGGVWSSEIVVVPAYHDGTRPYGDAKGTEIFCWEPWIYYSDPDHDMGIIRLDRPIGAVTGWYGCGWTSDLSFYLRTPFHNPGYPAETPYDGQHMYDWGGTFDRMEYPRVVVNRGGFGGQGGSGAHWEDSENHRYVYAVFSSGGSSRTYFPIITEGKFNDIKNCIDEITPSRFDLLALGVQVSPEAVRAGEQLESMSYVVYNHSSASRSGTFYVDVYLSTNDNISTSDTLIDRHSFTEHFGPKSMVRIEVSNPPTIPSGIASGEYWIGVILDVSDNDTTNNDSDGQEAARISVGPIFEDDFPGSYIRSTRWSYIRGATASTTGRNEPSPMYSLRLNGRDEIWSKSIDLSLYSGATLTYYYERTGGGESPDTGDDLIVEYLTSSTEGDLRRHPGSGPDMYNYEKVTIPLPYTALRSNFMLRMRTTGDVAGGDAFDDWFVDDVEIMATN